MKLFLSILVLFIFMTTSTCFAVSSEEDCISCTPTIEEQNPLNNKKSEMLGKITGALLSAPPAPFSLKIQPSTTRKPWKSEYTDFLYQTLSGDTFDALLKQKINQEDLKKINCSNFNDLDKEDKKKFYVNYLASIAESTSNFNNDEEYYSNKYKTTNYGLLQIDPKSAEIHAGSALEKPVNGEQLKTYQINLLAGSYILKHQISGKYATGRLFPEKTYYWPELQKKQEQILKTLNKNSENLSFCKNETIPRAIVVNEDEIENAPRAIIVDEETENAPRAIVVKEDEPILISIPTKDQKNSSEKPTLRRAYNPPLSKVKVSPSSDFTEFWQRLSKPQRPPMAGPAKLTQKPQKAPTPVVQAPVTPPALKPTRYPASDSKGLYVQAFTNRLTNLNEHSGGYCAKGVRKSLNTLFFGSTDRGPQGGPPAKGYDEDVLKKWRKGNSCFKKTSDNGKFQNYDIRVMETANKNFAGHIEIYFEGRWYSDFKQVYSLWNNGDSKYINKRLYRLSDNCSPAAISFMSKLLESIIESSVSESCASVPVQELSETTPFNFPDRLIAESGDWKIKEISINQGSKYVIFHQNKEIEKDSNSPYVLIERINDENLRKVLAESTFEKWVKRDGKEKVQSHILKLEVMTMSQIEAIKNAGFEIPPFVNVIGD